MTRTISALFLLLPATMPLAGQGEFWGELKAGRFGAGFRAIYELDPARSYDPDYPASGRTKVKKPRPVLAAIWYPTPPDQGKAMLHRDYFRAITLDSSAPDFAQRLRVHTRDQACVYMTGKEYEELTDDERGRWDGLLSTPVFAMLNAPPAEGKFPVILYHPGLGGTFEDNAVLCEFLASHGYVVIGSAFQAADSSLLHIDSDLETSFADLAVLVRFAGTLPFADSSRLAAIGHSYGAQAVMSWRAMPNSPVDAVVFLDSGILYAGVDAPLFSKVKAALDRNTKSPVPVIFFADRERHPHFETFAPYLKFAPHYEVDTPALEHNAFVAQGAIVKDEASRRTYEAVCNVILKFLDAHVLDADAPIEDALLHVRTVPGLPPPPTGAQIARLFRVDAAESRQALTSFLKSADPGAVVTASAILWDGDEKKQAVELLKQSARLHPKSAQIEESLGETLQQTGDRDGAQKSFDRALALLGGDQSLSADEKTQLQQAIETARKK